MFREEGAVGKGMYEGAVWEERNEGAGGKMGVYNWAWGGNRIINYYYNNDNHYYNNDNYYYNNDTYYNHNDNMAGNKVSLYFFLNFYPSKKNNYLIKVTKKRKMDDSKDQNFEINER